MEEKLRVECEFVGVVNGVPVTVTGRGHVGPGKREDERRRHLDVELLADVVPFGFDPAFLALGAFDAVLLQTAGGGRLHEDAQVVGWRGLPWHRFS